MKSKDVTKGFLPRVVLVTFAACWLFGTGSLLLAFGMGFEVAYLTSDEEGVSERVWQGFTGGFVGLLGGFIGALAFVLVVKLVAWITGFEIGDISFIEHWHEV
jgi:hypothetical protein